MATTGGYIRHHVYVDVLADYLWVAEDRDGELYLPVRATCTALDLESRVALETIKADSRLAPGLRGIRLPTPPKGEHEVQCLRSDEYTWWLVLVDPRRFKPERRPLLEERQRVLMRLAKEIMLKRTELRMLPQRHGAAPQAFTMKGDLQGDAHCPYCDGPVLVTYDGVGWHLHAAVEVK
jgi:hypothetical protein